MRNPLRTVLERFSDSTETVHECRKCGTNLPDADSTCPVCQSDEVASYDIRTG